MKKLIVPFIASLFVKANAQGGWAKITSTVNPITTFTSNGYYTHTQNQPKEPIKIIEKKDIEYAYPHWSNDGKQILFQSNQSGKWQIYLMDEHGKNITRITQDTANNNFIDWSPNNKTIAFVSDKTGNEEIFAIDLDGKNEKQLTFNKVRDIHPYFTPKGDKILFNSTRDDTTAFEIYSMNLDGTNVQRITNTPDDETCAHQSPSENKIIYLKNRNRISDIYLMDLVSNKEENLTNSKLTDGWPSWMNNGEEIIYSANEDDTYKLFTYNIKTKNTAKLTNPVLPYFDARANVTRDGKKVVFNRQVEGKKNTIGIYVLYLK